MPEVSLRAPIEMASTPPDVADRKQITTILFDCDNTLVLSEELAFEACADLSNEILAAHNVSERCATPPLHCPEMSH